MSLSLDGAIFLKTILFMLEAVLDSVVYLTEEVRNERSEKMKVSYVYLNLIK